MKKTKVCSKCKIKKSIEEFSSDSSRKDGHCYLCKKCQQIQHKIVYEKNKQKFSLRGKEFYKKNKKKIKLKQKIYRQNNKEKEKRRHKKYQKNNKEKLKKYQRDWFKKNKKKKLLQSKKYYRHNKKKILKRHSKYKKIRQKIDINFKLAGYLRTRIYQALKNNKKQDSTLKLIGCSIKFLKEYLESKFKPGMSWKNYKLKGWHIDHIIPCSKFDLSKKEEQQKCFHYTNMQPLWCEENWAKH
jgi:hypothetical protein